MKKVFKMAGIALVVLALASNLHSALFSYYGIKTNNLAGQVWAQGTSTDSTATSGDNTGGETSGTSSNDLFWDEQTNGCLVEEGKVIPVNTYANAGSTASIGFIGNTVNSISLGSEGTFSQTNDYVLIFTPGTKVDCPVSWGVCASASCRYDVGAKASYVFYNGRQIHASTSGH